MSAEREYVLVRIDKETWDEHQKNGECPVASACCGCHLDYAVEHDAAVVSEWLGSDEAVEVVAEMLSGHLTYHDVVARNALAALAAHVKEEQR